MRDVSWEFQGFIIKLGHLIFAVLYIFPKIVRLWMDLDPFKKLDLDCQSYICVGFGLDWQSQKMDWVIACIHVTFPKLKTIDTEMVGQWTQIENLHKLWGIIYFFTELRMYQGNSSLFEKKSLHDRVTNDCVCVRYTICSEPSYDNGGFWAIQKESP